MTKNTEEKIMSRPPIVVVLGHVDHGKTTLLDYIRKTNLASKEAGGITQSIGAYAIEHSGKQITFIDTPGHEAFAKMRLRGAHVADLSILVVAADDGVQPQTKESVAMLLKTETPYVVAINKIDRPNADVDRIKNELAQNGVLLEGLGGNISWQAISAKSGEGVNELLDLLLLTAELEELTWDPAEYGMGIIIEVKRDPQRGFTAIAIVKNGTLKNGSYIKTPTAYGKIKILENFLGKSTKELIPSSPALITGWEKLPLIGEEFKTSQIEEAETKNQIQVLRSRVPAKDKDANSIRILVKSDVSGSLETLSEILKNLKIDDKKIEIVDEGIGDITESDIKTAEITRAIIVGFKVKPNKDAQNLILGKKVRIITHEIIYELIKKLEEELKEVVAAVSGELEVLAVFDQKHYKKQVIGGRVTKGVINKRDPLSIYRENKVMSVGRIINLQQNKKDVTQIIEKQEAGLLFESDILIKVEDRLVVHEENRN